MSKIWVIGADGLVGEAIKKATAILPNEEFKFLGKIDLEIGRTKTVPFQEDDIVIDLIPIPFPRESSSLQAEEFHAKFTKPHLDFIALALTAKLKKYIFISSAGSIYGHSSSHTPLLETNNLNPVSYYGEAKKRIEEFLDIEIKKTKTKYTILRCSNIYNEDVVARRQTGLIGVLLKRFVNHEPIDIFGSTSITKDYISSGDVAKAILKCINAGNNEIYNIGSGKEYSIAEIVGAFEKSFNYKAIINCKAAISNDVHWFVLNIDKAKNELDFQAEVDLLNWIHHLE